MTSQITSDRNSSAKPLVLLLGIIGLLVAIGVAGFQRSRGYISTSRVLVTTARVPGLHFQPEIQEQKDLSSEILLIRSDEVIENAIVNGKLDRLPSMKGQPASEITRGLQVEQIEGTDVIQIEFQSTNPREAQAVASAVTDAYIQYHERQFEDTHDEPLAKLNKILAEAREDLSRQEAELATAGAELKQDSDEQLEQTRLSAYASAVAELEIKLTANRSKQSAIKALKALPQEVSKLQLAQEILELEAPPVSVEASIAGLKGSEESMQIQLEELRAKLEETEESRDRQLGVREKLKQLKASIDRKRAFQSEAMQRLKDLTLVRTYEKIDITVIAPASIGKRVESFLGKLFGL